MKSFLSLVSEKQKCVVHFLVITELISTENRMNASAFRDIWAQKMFFQVLKIARAAGEFNLRS